jgi:GWxTD domain-containing protein
MANRGLFFILACASLLLWSCSSSQPTAGGNGNANTYDFEANILHPKMLVYHHGNDSSQVWLQLNTSELLYTRLKSGMAFTARVRVEYNIAKIDNPRYIADSGKVTFADEEHAQKKLNVLGSFPVRMPSGTWLVNINVIDLNRNTQTSLKIVADKDDVGNAQNFLVLSANTQEPLFYGHAAVGDAIAFESKRNGITIGNADPSDFEVKRFASEVKLPPPPFSNSNPEIPAPEMAVPASIGIGPNGLPQFTAEGGLYKITLPGATEGANVLSGSNFYPNVSSYEQLVSPLRFITSKSEYDEIAKSKFPKKLIDNFWMECGGSKDKAKELIAQYYGRVEEANMYFTSHTEGWRTDRGMIHLIFGTPTKVNKNDNGEIWVYGDEGNPTSLSFSFTKIASPVSDNVYLLRRDPMYKPVWEQMVTSWRSGRVYNR